MPFTDTKIKKGKTTTKISKAEWDRIFESWIKKAVESCPLSIKCRRSSLLTGNFVKGIVEDISTSDIVIADLTGGRPNVYYELGIRHAIRNGTIIITQNLDQLPSDLRSYYCIEYNYESKLDRYDELYALFEKVIHKNINQIVKANYPADNPVSDFLGQPASKIEILENNVESDFATTDYVKHVVKDHRLPLEGVKNAFAVSNSIRELSDTLRSLSNVRLTCDHFKPEVMRTKLLTSINNARSCINTKHFDDEGGIVEP